MRNTIEFFSARGDEQGERAEKVRAGVRDVRLAVFVDEQHVPFVLEIDARDDESGTIHVLGCDGDGRAVAAGRLLADPHDASVLHVGRLAVMPSVRGQGVGARVVAALEAAAVAQKGVLLAPDIAQAEQILTIVLDAQEHAIGFYERCGYRLIDKPRFLDAGIWHRTMAKTV